MSVYSHKNLLLKALPIVAFFLIPLFFSSGSRFFFSSPKFFLLATLSVTTIILLVLFFYKHKVTFPRTHSVYLVAVGALLAILFITAVFGVDLQTSLWSTFRWATGLLAVALALAVSLPVLIFGSDRKFLRIVALSFVLFGLVAALFSYVGPSGLDINFGELFSEYSESTLGNTTSSGAVLIFPLAFSLSLFFLADKRRRSRYFWLFSFVFILLSPTYTDTVGLLSGATTGKFGIIGDAGAATLSIVAASIVSVLVYLLFGNRRRGAWAAGALLILCVVFSVFALPKLFQEDSKLQDVFIDQTSASRLLFWNTAAMGVMERPLVGWGMEHFPTVHQRYFDPIIFEDKYLAEVWVDKPHNIFLETALSGGILALATYLFIPFFVGLQLLKDAKNKRGKRERVLPIVLLGMLFAYMLQGFFGFDSVSSYLAYFGALAFSLAFLQRKGHKTEITGKTPNRKHQLAVYIAACLFWAVLVYYLSVLPAKESILTLNASRAPAGARTQDIQEVVSISPMGGLYDENKILGRFISSYREALPDLRGQQVEIVSNEIEDLIIMSGARADHYKGDFRSQLNTADLLNLKALAEGEEVNRNDLELALEYGLRAITVSPNNPLGYWTVAETHLIQSDVDTALDYAERAVGLDPSVEATQNFAIEITSRYGDYDLTELRRKEAGLHTQNSE